MAPKGLQCTEQIISHFTLLEAKLATSLPGKIVSPHSHRVSCNAVLLQSPMAGSLLGQQRQPLLLVKFSHIK